MAKRGSPKKHGLSYSPEHQVWAGMLQRCTNPKRAAYKNYGGRGITVCDRWRDFRDFYEDMGPRPSAKHSIHRLDNDGPYRKSNCCWATSAQQALNKRLAVARTPPKECSRYSVLLPSALIWGVKYQAFLNDKATNEFVGEALFQALRPRMAREVRRRMREAKPKERK